MVRIPGMFKNFDDLEEHLSLADLEALLEKAREVEHNKMKFQASLQNIDLDKGQTESAEERFEKVKRRAQAKIAGIEEDEFEFMEIGIDVVRE